MYMKFSQKKTLYTKSLRFVKNRNFFKQQQQNFITKTK